MLCRRFDRWLAVGAISKRIDMCLGDFDHMGLMKLLGKARMEKKNVLNFGLFKSQHFDYWYWYVALIQTVFKANDTLTWTEWIL